MNGLDVDQLLVFLREGIKVRNLCMLSDIQLLELVFPYCLDSLSSKMITEIQENWTFDLLH